MSDSVRPTLTLDAAEHIRWDAIVVGAGPAGALAALELARRDCRVLLVDKAAFPREKICGCCLNGAALSALEACGLSDVIKGAPALREMLLADGHRRAVLALPNSVALSRSVLDSALVRRAISAGAHFLSETSAHIGGIEKQTRAVTLHSGNQSAIARASVVVAADGLAGGALNDVTEFKTRIRPASHFGAGTIFDDAPDFYAGNRLYMACGSGGYAGLVRLEDGRLNLAAAFDPAFVKKLGGVAEAVEKTLLESDFPALPQIMRARWRGVPALTRSLNRVSAERVFVIGDAAGYVEPITGEGMAWALSAGRMVAPLAADGARKWTAELSAAWTQQYNEIRKRQSTCLTVSRLLRNQICTRAAVAVLSKFPQISWPLMRRLNKVVAML